MRRLVVILTCLSALAAPAAVLAARSAPDDGSLVVQRGEGTGLTSTDVPVVQMYIRGSVIGRVWGKGRIIIDAGTDNNADVQVLGAGPSATSTRSDTAQIWNATDFTFRAVGGKFTILVYGSPGAEVNLVAAGNGKVKLAGVPETPQGDGQYSLNGGPFVSLPGTQTDWRPISAND